MHKEFPLRKREFDILSSDKTPSPEDRRSAPPDMPLASVTRAASPAVTCDVRKVMLHLGRRGL